MGGVVSSSVLTPGIERSFAYRSAITGIVRLMSALTRRDWQGLEHLTRGGCVVAANHISYADPFAVAHVLHTSGYPPFFLAKDGLFRLPLLGPWLSACGQVPVHRGTSRAAGAYRDAVAAVRAGKLVVVMPESTITKDPELWPMAGKTGSARIALATGRPVIPLGQWGAQELMPPGTRRLYPWPRKTMRMRFGPPVDLADLQNRPLDAEILAEATERIMTAITTQVAALRDESPPVERFDPRVGRRVEPGSAQRGSSPEDSAPAADTAGSDAPRDEGRHPQHLVRSERHEKHGQESA